MGYPIGPLLKELAGALAAASLVLELSADDGALLRRLQEHPGAGRQSQGVHGRTRMACDAEELTLAATA